MRRAVISDIHGNLEALDAVLDDIRGQGIDEVICLGDVVGYGPNPCECIDRVTETCRVTLMGDHDRATIAAWVSSRPPTDRAVAWTIEQLDPGRDWANNIRRRAFLLARPPSHRAGLYLFVHGSPRNPLSEYVFPEDIFNRRETEQLFRFPGRCCFQGHTHIPGIFTSNSGFLSPGEIGMEYTLGAGRRMIDVGSVGQPRDGDDRACYAILDEPDRMDQAGGIGARAAPRVTFRRVPYDVEATIRKMRDITG